jgi:hypothetical protein
LDIDENMTAQRETQTSDSGGASGSALSAPQPTPIFEWALDYGTIRVFQIEKGVVAIAFDHNYRDEIYAEVELHGYPHYDAVSLVYEAATNYDTQFLVLNPFVQLLEEPEAMQQLSKLLQKIRSDE